MKLNHFKTYTEKIQRNNYVNYQRIWYDYCNLTPLGEGAIGIVRLSGTDAVAIANKVFKGKNLETIASHTINYGHIVENDETIDEVMVSVMRAPKTFTREDVVEINTHGGVAVTNEILQLLIRSGARMAEPGEFTKRAFLNGRVDLTQAEAVMDLIRAKTDKAMAVAVSQLDGSLKNSLTTLAKKSLTLWLKSKLILITQSMMMLRGYYKSCPWKDSRVPGTLGKSSGYC